VAIMTIYKYTAPLPQVCVAAWIHCKTPDCRRKVPDYGNNAGADESRNAKYQ
jgi:hypothetical protein